MEIYLGTSRVFIMLLIAGSAYAQTGNKKALGPQTPLVPQPPGNYGNAFLDDAETGLNDIYFINDGDPNSSNIDLYEAVGDTSNPDAIDKLIATFPNPTKKIASGILSVLPAQPRAGVSDYLQAVGYAPDGMENLGLNKWHQDLLEKNSCLMDLTSKFYRELPTTSKGRPNITSKPSDYGLQPGWLWERATSASGGDPHLAMQIIGTCGHDDVSNEVFCPWQESPMYAPQGLGAGYDVPDDLVTRIGQVQAPSLGPAVIPAKSYHVLGGAYSACLLLRKGVPAPVSRRIVMGALNAYRTKRVCEVLNTGVEFHDRIFQAYSIFANTLSKKSGTLTTEDCEEVEDLTVKAECGYYAGEDRSKMTQRYRRIVAMADAERLFKSNRTFFKTSKCEGLQLSQNVRTFLEGNRHSKNKEGCPGINKQRCEEARKLIETYFVDFEWSEAQHRAGFNFAKDNCPKMEAGKDLNAVACKAMGSSTTPETPGTQRRNTAQ